MNIAVPFLAFLLVGAFAAYHRLRLSTWTALTATALVACWLLGASGIATAAALVLLAAIAVPLLLPGIRLPYIAAPLLKFYSRILPPLSETERVALEAGTVGFEGELFSGKPDWQVLLDQPAPALSAEEQAFLDGPVEELCLMTNDWDITHVRADLPPEMWEFIKKNRFFGLIVPKEYGGLGFSALANHKVIQKLASISSVVSSTVGVPNSLGPGELLMMFGTAEQKDYWLPRLADGRDIPAFALTSLDAGSDAASMGDSGVVCWGEHEGQKTLGMRVSWSKRYISLAPICTVLGLAFKLRDPDGLLGGAEDLGITVALVPTDTPGVVSVQIPVQTGSRNEVEKGKSGFAHFFEHMMFRGTPNYSAEEYGAVIKAAGA
ncbi:MAG: acyl-CoA dehydrogenase family protein, partial [Proteobacteria bacterium]|nr:acyl-CoA dehydrogenase family protein [Pseudomonadota bacterium]